MVCYCSAKLHVQHAGTAVICIFAVGATLLQAAGEMVAEVKRPFLPFSDQFVFRKGFVLVDSTLNLNL